MPITTLTGLISDTVFSLSAEDVHRSCGVALDIGSTVGKIVYRSNKEYKNGQPINVQDDTSRGTVHYAMFPRADVTGMISYIKDNCDLMAGPAGEVVVKSAGVGGAAFRAEIEAGLNCRMKILPEFDCFCQAFLAVEKMTPASELFMPLSPDNQAAVDAQSEQYKAHMKMMMEKMKDHSQMTFGAVGPGLGDVKEEDRPRLLMMAGSACGVMQINSDGTFYMVDGVLTGGRYMYGLASMLTGENDFEKLVEMAETSDGKTVNLSFSDVIGGQSSARPKDNVYESMIRHEEKEDRRCFPFGKGVTTPLDKMKKGDLAYSVFYTTAEIHGHLLRSCIKQSKAREVYVCGNVFNTEFMRLLLSGVKAEQSARLPPELQYKMKFLRNGGMYGALGAFLNTQ